MKLDSRVLDTLRAAETDGNALRLTGQLDRKLYAEVNKALVAAGGKWNRGQQAHLFDGDAAAILAGLLEGETVTTAQEEGYFPTPAPVVARILMYACLEPGMTVLEPSAGDGAIAGPATSWGCWVDCVELNPERAAKLQAAGFARSVAACDFLTVPPRRVYDRVLMNPPFARKQDITHVQHALGFVKPGGLLVAIMAGGVTFRQDRATAGFRDLVGEAGGQIIPLSAQSFKESGTEINTVLVAIPVAGTVEAPTPLPPLINPVQASLFDEEPAA